jgi:thioredoxin
MTVQVTDTSFEQDVLNAGKPVVVDFWAEWCGPCKMLGPILDEAAVEFGDKVVIAKMNVDENQTTPGSYGVRSIPTLVLFKDGSPVSTQVGVLTKSALITWINSNLS